MRKFSKDDEAIRNLSPEQFRVTQQNGTEAPGTGEYLERVVNFSTVSAMIYVRPLPLLDLVNFLDGTKSLSK
jgi:hypothetical protein